MRRDDDVIQPRQQFQSGRRDPRPHDPAVVLAARPRDQAALLHAIQQPRHVRVAADHPIGHFPARQPVAPRAAEDAEHVVLRGREIRIAQHFGHLTLEHIRGPRHVQRRLLLERIEGSDLLDFLSQ